MNKKFIFSTSIMIKYLNQEVKSSHNNIYFIKMCNDLIIKKDEIKKIQTGLTIKKNKKANKRQKYRCVLWIDRKDQDISLYKFEMNEKTKEIEISLINKSIDEYKVNKGDTIGNMQLIRALIK